MRINIESRMEYWHRRFREAANPMCVWEAIAECRGGFSGEKFPLPEWCLNYLEDCAEKLKKLERGAAAEPAEFRKDVKTSPFAQALRDVPNALGLSRPGWNAFERDNTQEEKHRAAARYYILTQAEQRTAAEAHRIMLGEPEWAKYSNDIRGLQKIISAGRRISSLPAKKTRVAKPAP